ncbi:hypothetical protein GTP46_03230 [Duganella sp. FT135W]|uniref:Uncharacterized protein n=1 Tax=Duganella flavida TaxID=2692175 RepID=A0A6L8KBB2_9BURK|nr:hypothetical protein [Duganella flavida]MYM21661.1 hypothetical protein [Duganella flavida]
MKYLRNAEAFCAAFLPLLFWWDWARSDTPVAWEVRIAATTLMSAILLQGALYWHLKLQAFKLHQSLPGWFQQLYTAFKYANVMGIAAVLALVASRSTSVTNEDLGWAGCVLLLVVAEQINYYHYQLMYDTRGAFAYLRRHGRLREAALALDLKRSKTNTI